MPAARHRRAEGDRRVLAPLVRVMDDGRGPALRHGHVQRRQDQFGAQMGLHRPADHPPAPHVEDDGQVQEPRRGRDVGDVRHPQVVGPRRREVPGDEIRGGRLGRVPDRRPGPPAPTDALHAEGTHQPSHPLAADVDPARGQLGVHPGRAIRAARRPVDGVDVRAQLDVGARAR